MKLHALIPVLALAGGAAASPAVHHPSAPTGTAEETLAPDAVVPAAPAEGWIVTRESAPEAGVHAGELSSTAGAPGVRVLTQGEERKLAIARRAVEAARAAGTLLVTPRPSTVVAGRAAGAGAARYGGPVLPGADAPAAEEAGVGVRVPARPGNPLAPMTDWERAKREGLVVPLPEHFPASGASAPGHDQAAGRASGSGPRAEGGAR